MSRFGYSSKNTLYRSVPAEASNLEFSPNELVGQQRFRIIRLLGMGGMGAVYLAEDLQIANEEVAIKFLLPSLIKNQQARHHFTKELQIVRKLGHPNIVSTFELYQEGEKLFFSMEYVPGLSLREWLEQGGNQKLSWQLFLQLLRPLCKALDYAHQFTLHRDLKPDNILLATSNRQRWLPKLSDFGLAGCATAHGTFPYMAPEQQQGAGATVASEVYSLGVLCYEMITGDFPKNPLPALSNWRAGFPGYLDAVLAKALCSNPTERYQSVAEFWRAIAQENSLVEKESFPPEQQEDKQGVTPYQVQRQSHQKHQQQRSEQQLLQQWLQQGAEFAGEHSWQLRQSYASAFAQQAGLERESKLWLNEEVFLSFVLVPPGKVTLSPTKVLDIQKPFYLASFPITQLHWLSVIEEQPMTWKGPHRPVERISPEQCQDFIDCLEEKTGNSFGFPTAIEWEYAYRAGSVGRFFFEESSRKLDEFAWYLRNSKGRTHRVGQKLPNPWGLYDMAGQLWEWCTEQEPDSKISFVARGGNVFSTPESCSADSQCCLISSPSRSIVGLRLVWHYI